MKKLLHNLNNGKTTLIDAPIPNEKMGSLVCTTYRTLVSAGTERMLVDFGKANYIQKARQQPDKVREVLQKVRTDGILTTVGAVRSKLSEPLALGYSNVGVVRSVGPGVDGFERGDRVISNGPHSEVIRVPQNLCAKIPGAVSDDEAAFTVVGAIGLQGVRLIQPTLGESVVVTGAGLIGLLTVQLLRAHGCRVMAIDFDDSKLALARQLGAETCNPRKGEDPVQAGIAFSRGRGVDAVLITAATNSNDPVTQAARMSRKRGRIILVGVTGLQLNRSDFYEKELTFQVSCSYGPGRYDPAYEEKGQDYPFGFVRWTEQRNFEAVLDMMADRRLDVTPLISHRFHFEEAPNAYEALSNDASALGILIEYNRPADERFVDRVALQEAQRFEAGRPVVSFVGAGNYASRVLIPAFKAGGAKLQTLVTSGGTSSVIHGRKAGFAEASTNLDAALAEENSNTVTIATQHNTHAPFVEKALQAGKHVFVEKPLALTHEEVQRVESAYRAAHADSEAGPLLMVGFNRRFAPHIVTIKQALDTVRAPKALVMTVNAGEIPGDHWTQDPEAGGGRIIGEACHFIDLLRYLVNAPIQSATATAMDVATRDSVSLQLSFEDGSIGTVHYLANGNKAFPKERLEVFCGARVLQLDNFRKLRSFGWPGVKSQRLWHQDKGQTACAKHFLQAVQNGGPAPIGFEELMEVSRITIDLAEQARGTARQGESTT
jgi:predicted dehydrogenase/threonine dehydrogenase-like Zn-dependent dehydrogenase